MRNNHFSNSYEDQKYLLDFLQGAFEAKKYREIPLQKDPGYTTYGELQGLETRKHGITFLNDWDNGAIWIPQHGKKGYLLISKKEASDSASPQLYSDFGMDKLPGIYEFSLPNRDLTPNLSYPVLAHLLVHKDFPSISMGVFLKSGPSLIFSSLQKVKSVKSLYSAFSFAQLPYCEDAETLTQSKILGILYPAKHDLKVFWSGYNESNNNRELIIEDYAYLRGLSSDLEYFKTPRQEICALDPFFLWSSLEQSDFLGEDDFLSWVKDTVFLDSYSVKTRDVLGF